MATLIYKDADYNSVKVDSYRSVLSRVNKENIELKKKNTELQEKNQQILRQKKQFRNVILLIIIVIACGIGIYFLNDNLTSTKGKLDTANGTIQEQTQVISNKDGQISNLNNNITNLQDELSKEKNLRTEAEEKLSKVCSSYPFIVTNCEVSSSSFSFDYYAPEEKELTVTLKAVNDKNSQVVTSNHTDTYYKGGGHKSFSFDYTLSSSDYYYVVLMYDGKIIAGKKW